MKQLDYRTLLNTPWADQFSARQKRVIQMGIDEGVDVSAYAKPELDADDMTTVFLEMATGHRVSTTPKGAKR